MRKQFSVSDWRQRNRKRNISAKSGIRFGLEKSVPMMVVVFTTKANQEDEMKMSKSIKKTNFSPAKKKRKLGQIIETTKFFFSSFVFRGGGGDLGEREGRVLIRTALIIQITAISERRQYWSQKMIS